MLGNLVRRFIFDRGANTAMIFALSIIPIIFLTAMGMDFTSATSKRIMLNAAVDAAALSMVTPSAMDETCAQAQTNAQNVFMGQASLISGLNYGAPTFGGCQDNATTRTVTVRYTAYSINTCPRLADQYLGDDVGYFRIVDRDRDQRAEHQFLLIARQLAVHGHRRDDRRDQYHGRQYIGAGRLRLRLP